MRALDFGFPSKTRAQQAGRLTGDCLCRSPFNRQFAIGLVAVPATAQHGPALPLAVQSAIRNPQSAISSTAQR
jgi:hypothetical protein